MERGWKDERKEGREGIWTEEKNAYCKDYEMRVWANAVFGDLTVFKTFGTDPAMTHSPF
jgi:hypothetical protein